MVIVRHDVEIIKNFHFLKVNLCQCTIQRKYVLLTEIIEVGFPIIRKNSFYLMCILEIKQSKNKKFSNNSTRSTKQFHSVLRFTYVYNI